MGYYKDTGSLQSMASAEAILKKRMPEKVGILPVAELLFVAESMWVGEHDMKGHFHPSFRFVKAKRYNAKPHVLIELDGGNARRYQRALEILRRLFTMRG